MTIQDALRSARTALPASDAPDIDAERLVLHSLGQRESAWLYAHSGDKLTAEQQTHLEALIARRATGEPLAYILGEWEFYGRPFLVTPDVLVPRPETEKLVEAALEYIRAHNKPLTVADVGTGSGIIAITLACELAQFKIQNSKFKILATDISPAALIIAKKNAERHGVADRIEFVEGDMLAPLEGRQVDLIVSNPPYIPTQEVESHFAPKMGASRDKLEARGLKFEPRIALDGGPDGQTFVEQIKAAGIPALVEVTGGRIERY
jgi:release factor glutamine methyltransferase